MTGMSDDPAPCVVGNRFAGAAGPGGPGPARDLCHCVGDYDTRPAEVAFHAERQDTGSDGWRRLCELVDEAAADGRTTFTPLKEMTPAQRRDVVTLPPGIAGLTAVTHLVLYGSNLVRIPPQIGAMTNLTVFEPYTSGRLHWFPYEITRCTRLRSSTVSTRVLYGNFKYRPPFPALRPVTTAAEADVGALDPAVFGTERVETCSVCDRPVERELHQAWLSLGVGTDVLPLLVNACSAACVRALPPGAGNHVPAPHHGGPGVAQPPTDW